MDTRIYQFENKASYSRGRMNNEEALFHWQNTPFYDLASAADQFKKVKFPEKQVSYTMFRIINYTDVCDIECNFCSFMKSVESKKGYVLTIDQILEKTNEAWQKDYRQIFFQGGVNPQIPFDYYLNALNSMKTKFPGIHIRAFSPVEIREFSKLTQRSIENVLTDLRQAGLDSFPGAGAEILSSRMRNILSGKKTTPQEWYDIMAAALHLGLKASTNIVWGSVETAEEIIEHLSMIRKLQDETKNILSFVPWTFQQQTKGFKVRHVPSHEYLKMISLSRLYLDNIDHIEVSLLVKGKQVGELALYSGADDINSPVYEENVLRSYGLSNEQECIEFIKEAGFEPKRRSFNFVYGEKS
ncbi:MAG: radical SAM protein [Spirochaetia bacterium]|nr:radical SAM protein [Spirochaetia bacterium]